MTPRVQAGDADPVAQQGNACRSPAGARQSVGLTAALASSSADPNSAPFVDAASGNDPLLAEVGLSESTPGRGKRVRESEPEILLPSKAPSTANSSLVYSVKLK